MNMEQNMKGISANLKSILESMESSWSTAESLRRQAIRESLEKDMNIAANSYFGSFTPDSSYAKNSSLRVIARDMYGHVLQKAGFFYVPHDDDRIIMAVRDGIEVDMTSQVKKLIGDTLNSLGRGSSKQSIEGV